MFVDSIAKWFKRFNCDHRKQRHYNCELVLQPDGTWITQHTWECMRCGKKIKHIRRKKMKNKKKWSHTVVKFQRSIGGSMVLMYNKDRSIFGEQPMDEMLELLFDGRNKMYCKCRYRNEDGYLEIGEEVRAYW